MILSDRQRLCLLALLLIVSLAAAGMSGQDAAEEGAAAPSARGSESPSTEGASPTPMKFASLDPATVIKREAVELIKVDIFESRSWQPPPSPPAKSAAAPPPKPVAPPLPFVYAGQLGDPATGKIIVYLSAPDRTLTVTNGDVIDDQYRLDSIADGQLDFVYLPLNAHQFLAIPGK